MQYLHHLGIFAFTKNWKEYCITLAKPRSNTIPTPYCEYALNHSTNEGIVKLVTLMVKGNETIT